MGHDPMGAIRRLVGALRGGRDPMREERGGTGLPAVLSRDLSRALLADLLAQRDQGVRNGLYEATVVSFVFNHERIEGNETTEWQTRDIIETRDRVLGDSGTPSDIRETANHSLMFDYLLDHTEGPLTLELIQGLHAHLMQGVMETAGQWKTIPNGVGGIVTAAPAEVPKAMAVLVSEYERFEPSIENIVRFHVRFETIHPFADGNGRVGRAIMFRECLRAGFVPFIVTDKTKDVYYRGLGNFSSDQSILVRYALEMQKDYLRASLPLMTDRELAERAAGAFPELAAPTQDAPAFTGPLKDGTRPFAEAPGRTRAPETPEQVIGRAEDAARSIANKSRADRRTSRKHRR